MAIFNAHIYLVDSCETLSASLKTERRLCPPHSLSDPALFTLSVAMFSEIWKPCLNIW